MVIVNILILIGLIIGIVLLIKNIRIGLERERFLEKIIECLPENIGCRDKAENKPDDF